MNLAGPELDQLAEYARTSSMIGSTPTAAITDLDTTLSLRKPEVRVAIDRERAADLDIPVATIADSLRVMVGGLPVTTFRDGGEQYDVWLRAEAEDRDSPEALENLNLDSPTAGLVKLTSLARLEPDLGPTEIERLDRERIVTVLGNPTERDAAGRDRRPVERDPRRDRHGARLSGRRLRPGEDARRRRSSTSRSRSSSRPCSCT